MLSLTVHNLGDVTVFRCAGRIEFGGGDGLQASISTQSQMRIAVLDLAEISAIDAAGLGILLSVRGWARAAGVELKLMNLTPKVEELLELTGLRSAFEVLSGAEMLDLLCRAIHQSRSEEASAAIETFASVLDAAKPFPLKNCYESAA